MNSSACSRMEWYADVPLVVFPMHHHPTPEAHAAALRACADRYLPRVGSILFRGFEVHHPDDFLRFTAAFGASVALAGPESIRRRRSRGRLWVACTGPAHSTTITDLAAPYDACTIGVDWEPGDVLLLEAQRMSLEVPAALPCPLAFAVERTGPTPIS